MAVDYQIPLVTNVKNAKMLIEAMSRFPGDFEILDIDCKTTNPLPDAKHSAPNGPLTLRPYVLGQISNSYFKGIHILSVSQFKREHLHLLFSVAQEMRLGVDKHGILDILKGKLLCLCFYEPSTRTSASFDAAMQRLGGRTMNVTGETSSVRKGESLSDTLRTVGSYADAIVLRHPDPESGVIAAKFSPVPVICGGFGSLEHTTQVSNSLFHKRITLTLPGFPRSVHYQRRARDCERPHDHIRRRSQIRQDSAQFIAATTTLQSPHSIDKCKRALLASRHPEVTSIHRPASR